MSPSRLEYRDDSDIGKLMHDFNCTSAEENNRNGQCIVRFAYDMLAFLFSGSQKQSEVGWGWLKIWSQGSFWLSGKVVCFPQTGIKYGDYSEKTRFHKETRHPTFKSDASFCHAKYS